jgi:hypothetical protein
MSTASASPSTMPPKPREITVYSHSMLFYWWPVWFVGYILAALTLWDQHLLMVVPIHAEVKPIEFKDEKVRNVVTVPDNESFLKDEKGSLIQPTLYVAQSKNYGVIFCLTLLLTIFITSVSLRGMWSILVIVVIVMGVTILMLAGYWEKITSAFSLLDIRINLGGYLFTSTGLLIIWLIAFMFFDRQIYVTFSPGQLRVRTEIGDGEKVYDATGLTFEKQRSDIFRHGILGLWFLNIGTGDLIIKTSGAQNHTFDLPNVIGVEYKIKAIEQLMQSKDVNLT